MAFWKRQNDSDDPLEKSRRKLEEQQRQLSAQMSELEEKLKLEQNPPPPEPVEKGLPVWRLEEEQSFVRDEEPFENKPPKRVLRAQRQRDFRLFLILFVILALIVAWLISNFA